LAKLDFNQKTAILGRLLEPYFGFETPQAAKCRVRKSFLDWKVKVLALRDVATQSFKSMQTTSFKRRWEKP